MPVILIFANMSKTWTIEEACHLCCFFANKTKQLRWPLQIHVSIANTRIAGIRAAMPFRLLLANMSNTLGSAEPLMPVMLLCVNTPNTWINKQSFMSVILLFAYMPNGLAIAQPCHICCRLQICQIHCRLSSHLCQ